MMNELNLKADRLDTVKFEDPEILTNWTRPTAEHKHEALSMF